MKSKRKHRSPFDLDIKPIRIPRFKINPELLELLAERRRLKSRKGNSKIDAR